MEWCEYLETARQEMMGYNLYLKVAVQKCLCTYFTIPLNKNMQNMSSKLHILKLKVFQFEMIYNF